MTKQELLEELNKLAKLSDNGDLEEIHVEADELLLKYIGDLEIKKAFDDIRKWYA